MKRLPLSITGVKLLSLSMFMLLFSINSNAQHQQFYSPIMGRWDITITTDNGKQYPAWLEVTLSGNSMLVGRFVASGGSARPVAHVYFNDNKLSFSIPPQWEQETNDLKVEGTLQGDNLTGTMVSPAGKTVNWTAVRAPSLKRTKEPTWGKAEPIFNGKDLTGWHALGNNQWVVENGSLKSPHSGANLVTDKAYNDFKLHLEFRCPEGSNSGVYLRGRYEIQIEDGDTTHPAFDRLGGVYGFIEPSEDAGKKAGEWQSYDVTLVGRMVTVALNGKTIICNREIPGVTGGALDSKEGEPGPLQIQGDHGPIEYRNITMAEAK